MARVVPGEVEELVSNPDDIDLDVFIRGANLVVTQVLGDSGLPTTLLKEIERWLAAHFFCIRDPRAQSEKIGSASITYQGKTGMGLEHTSFGQQVLILDTTGKMASQTLPRASFSVITHDELPSASDSTEL